jgi:hypothetical protein
VLVSANLYPWDVDGDPEAPARLAGTGLSGVTLAAAYHAVRAVTPLHPRHRIVTRDAAVYYRASPDRWGSRRPRPALGRPAGSFERAASRLRAAGLPVTAWAVLTHNARAGTGAPDCVVRNAYGDPYPWALCAAQPAVVAYASALAAEVAALPEASAVELEACGWYGAGHASAHEKTSGLITAETEWLLSACFCPTCEQAYRSAGADPASLRASVRAALNASLAAPPGGASSREPAGGGAAAGGTAGQLPGEVEHLLTVVRSGLAANFQRNVIAAVRAAAPGKPVYLHAHPDPRATGANPGCDPAGLLRPGGADGIVLACWDPATAPGLVARTAKMAPPGAVIAASLLAVTGMGGDPGTLPAQAAAVAAAGATELRLYHASLASLADLAAIRTLCAALTQ